MVRYEKEAFPPGNWKGFMPQIVKDGKIYNDIIDDIPMTGDPALNPVLD